MARRLAGCPAPPQTAYLQVGMSQDFKEWLKRLAMSQRMPLTAVVERSIVDFARQQGFPEPAPIR